MNIKSQLVRFLSENKYDDITLLSKKEKKTLTALISLTYDKKSPIAWRAIEAIGLAAGELAKTDRDAVRSLIERLLWMIRDESGGIGWSSPEILGEIVRQSPDMFSDIAPIIISFHDEPPLRAGVLRAAGRIGNRNVEMRRDATPVLISCLRDTDSSVRGHAAWALGELGVTEASGELEKVTGDSATFPFYHDGDLKQVTVGEMAAGALHKIRSDSQ